MKRSTTLMVALCSALAVACASTSIAMVRSTSVLAAGMFVDHTARVHARTRVQEQTTAPAGTQPWWAGFEDAPMNRLMSASRNSGTAQQGGRSVPFARQLPFLHKVSRKLRNP